MSSFYVSNTIIHKQHNIFLVNLVISLDILFVILSRIVFIFLQVAFSMMR